MIARARGIKPGDRVRVDDGGQCGNYSGEGTVTNVYVKYGVDWVDVDGIAPEGPFPFSPHRVSRLGGPDVVERVGAYTSAAPSEHALPTDSAARKGIPITTGVLDYFPAALAYIATVSKAGNDKHNPGEPLHWARGKSTDQADAIGRHLLERGGVDPDTGLRHSGELAWRALALLQLELEEAGLAPLARGAGA